MGRYITWWYIYSFVIVLLTSCHSKKMVTGNMQSTDSTFLKTKSSLYVIDSNMMEDSKILFEAQKRMEKYKRIQQGRFKWDTSFRKDIRISEDLFEYVLASWKQENRLVECGLYKIKRKKGKYVLSPTKMPMGDTINPPDPENLEWKYGGISYRDSIFLRIEGDLVREPQNIWENRIVYSIYVRAVERLYQHIFPVNGYIKWNVMRGREVKISENIFVYITDEWRKDNEKIKTGKYELRRDLSSGGLFAVPKDEPFESRGWERIE